MIPHAPRRHIDARMLGTSALAAALVLAGCSTLDGYRGTYEGQIVDQSPDEEAFVRRGFAADTLLRLDFNPANATVPMGNPGAITTSTPDGAPRLFDATPLLVIEPLSHDLLSDYDFPDGRLRSYIFAARVRDDDALGAFAGRDATVFVSLMKGGSVEVRILVGQALYGYFYLRKPDPEEGT